MFSRGEPKEALPWGAEPLDSPKTPRLLEDAGTASGKNSPWGKAVTAAKAVRIGWGRGTWSTYLSHCPTDPVPPLCLSALASAQRAPCAPRPGGAGTVHQLCSETFPRPSHAGQRGAGGLLCNVSFFNKPRFLPWLLHCSTRCCAGGRRPWCGWAMSLDGEGPGPQGMSFPGRAAVCKKDRTNPAGARLAGQALRVGAISIFQAGSCLCSHMPQCGVSRGSPRQLYLRMSYAICATRIASLVSRSLRNKAPFRTSLSPRAWAPGASA